MSNKPDWKDAPEWAMWLAADGAINSDNSFWVFFENKPELENLHGGTWISEYGKWLQTDTLSTGYHGLSTLEPRP